MDDAGNAVFEGNALSNPEDPIARIAERREDIALIKQDKLDPARKRSGLCSVRVDPCA